MPQPNLGQIGSLFRNLGDDLVAPILKGMGTRANPGASVPSLTRSVGPIKDSLTRPASRFQQLSTNIYSPVNARLGQSGEKIIRQRTGRGTPDINNFNEFNGTVFGNRSQNPIEQFFQEYGQPRPVSGKYPLNDPLNLLQAKGRYLQRQVQQGVQGGLQKLEGALPTALNPFATRTPGTLLGKIGQSLNPLNPVNLRNSAAGAAVNFLPIGEKNQAALQGALTLGGLTPLGVIAAIAANDIYNPLGLTDAQEAQKIQDMVRGPYTNSQGGDLSARDERGRVWAGRDYGFQSPESFNKLFGANLPTAPRVWAGSDYGFQSPESFNKLFGANLPTAPGRGTLNSSSAPGTQNSLTQNQAQPRTAPPASTLPPPPGGAAAERAYQAERSSAAQQAKQNPGLPISYSDQAELARQSLQGYNPASGPLPGAAQTAQDMGMAIWAKKYGPGSKNDLASKVRPGQSGFGAIQNTLAASVANTGFQPPTQLSFTPPSSVTPTPFPMEALQSGLQVPGAPITDLLSNYPGFDPNNVDIKLFSKFMQANPKK